MLTEKNLRPERQHFRDLSAETQRGKSASLARLASAILVHHRRPSFDRLDILLGDVGAGALVRLPALLEGASSRLGCLMSGHGPLQAAIGTAQRDRAERLRGAVDPAPAIIGWPAVAARGQPRAGRSLCVWERMRAAVQLGAGPQDHRAPPRPGRIPRRVQLRPRPQRPPHQGRVPADIVFRARKMGTGR